MAQFTCVQQTGCSHMHKQSLAHALTSVSSRWENAANGSMSWLRRSTQGRRALLAGLADEWKLIHQRLDVAVAKVTNHHLDLHRQIKAGQSKAGAGAGAGRGRGEQVE